MLGSWSPQRRPGPGESPGLQPRPWCGCQRRVQPAAPWILMVEGRGFPSATLPRCHPWSLGGSGGRCAVAWIRGPGPAGPHTSAFSSTPAARRRWTLRTAVYLLQVCRSAEPCVTVVRSSPGLALRCSLSPGGVVTTPLPWPPGAPFSSVDVSHVDSHAAWPVSGSLPVRCGPVVPPRSRSRPGTLLCVGDRVSTCFPVPVHISAVFTSRPPSPLL